MAEAKSKKNTIEKRSLLAPRDRETMMAVLIRNKEVFETFREKITEDTFGTLDVGYAFAWQVVNEHYNTYESLPDRNLLMSELESALENYQDALNETERADLEAFVDIAFDDETWKTDLSTSPKHAKVAVNLLKKFLQERLAAKAQEIVKSQSSVPVDLPGVFDTFRTESEEIAAINTGGSEVTFPEDWDKSGGINMFTTGLPFFDTFFGGGHAAGEVYGLLGPFGSCKTTLAIMLTVNAAHQAAEAVADPDYDGRPGYAIYVSYEAQMDEMRFRALSYSAKIQRSSLEKMGTDGMKSLSTSKTLKPYEKNIWKKNLAKQQKVPGEQSRAKEAINLLNKHTLFIDLTGADSTRRGAGGGYVEEIARIISWEMRKRGGKPVCVVVDYVGAMARRYMAAANKDDSALRHLIAGAPLRLKTLIATQFGVPVWALHQLNGDANDKSPGAKIHHTDAAEARSYGENLDFACIIGSPTFDGLCQIACTKHRRTGATKNAIVQIVGSMNRVDATGDLYTIVNSQIIENKIVKSVGSQSSSINEHKNKKNKAKLEADTVAEKSLADVSLPSQDTSDSPFDDDTF